MVRESLKTPGFKTKEFLTEVVELVRMQLPPDLQEVHVVGPMGSLVKLHYGNPKVHYEVWVRRRDRVLEAGLHFEGRPEENARYLSELTARHAQAITSLGPKVAPEEWAGSWTRVHQEFPFTKLDEDLLMVVSGRLAQIITTLEPAVRKIASSTTSATPGHPL